MSMLKTFTRFSVINHFTKFTYKDTSSRVLVSTLLLPFQLKYRKGSGTMS